MNADTLEQTGELAAMLDASDDEPRPLVDPTTLPVRFHRLKHLALSAAHYHHSCQLGDGVDSLALRMGAGVHAGLFGDRPLVCYRARRAGKEWDAFRREHQASRAVILNEREMSIAQSVIASIRRHTRAMDLLFDWPRSAVLEHTFSFELLGRACRATPDSYVPGVRVLDLKSTRSAEPRAFARDALRRHYHAQLAFYDEGLERYTGKRCDELYLVAVENVPPYPVVVWRLPDATRTAGARLVRAWMEQLLLAEQSGVYPGYVETELELVIPEWMRDDDEESDGPLQLEVDGELVEVE